MPDAHASLPDLCADCLDSLDSHCEECGECDCYDGECQDDWDD